MPTVTDCLRSLSALVLKPFKSCVAGPHTYDDLAVQLDYGIPTYWEAMEIMRTRLRQLIGEYSASKAELQILHTQTAVIEGMLGRHQRDKGPLAECTRKELKEELKQSQKRVRVLMVEVTVLEERLGRMYTPEGMERVKEMAEGGKNAKFNTV